MGCNQGGETLFQIRLQTNLCDPRALRGLRQTLSSLDDCPLSCSHIDQDGDVSTVIDNDDVLNNFRESEKSNQNSVFNKRIFAKMILI